MKRNTQYAIRNTIIKNLIHSATNPDACHRGRKAVSLKGLKTGGLSLSVSTLSIPRINLEKKSRCLPVGYTNVLIIFSIFLLSGCAGLAESIKGFAGYPVKILERNRNSAIIKNLDYDYPAAYNKVIDILKRAQTYIYLQDPKKGLIAVYVSQTDTTPVGIFFTEKDADNTQIEISSPSIYGKEVVAKRIILGLEGGRPDAKE